MTELDFISTGGSPWKSRPGHRRWLEQQAESLFAYFEQRAICSSGGTVSTAAMSGL